MSLGAYPEMSLDEARVIAPAAAAPMSPRAKTRWASGARTNGKAPVLTPSGAPTFGHRADEYIALKEGGWKNRSITLQWVASWRPTPRPSARYAGR